MKQCTLGPVVQSMCQQYNLFTKNLHDGYRSGLNMTVRASKQQHHILIRSCLIFTKINL